MLLIWAVGLGLLIGLIRWRGPEYLARLQLRLGWLVVAAVVLQLLTVRLGPSGLGSEPGLRGGLLLLSYVGVLVGVLGNRHLWPVWVLGAGFALNLLVILPHGGYMPITREAYEASGQAREADVLTDGAKLTRAKDVVL